MGRAAAACDCVPIGLLAHRPAPSCGRSCCLGASILLAGSLLLVENSNEFWGRESHTPTMQPFSQRPPPALPFPALEVSSALVFMFRYSISTLPTS